MGATNGAENVLTLLEHLSSHQVSSGSCY